MRAGLVAPLGYGGLLWAALIDGGLHCSEHITGQAQYRQPLR